MESLYPPPKSHEEFEVKVKFAEKERRSSEAVCRKTGDQRLSAGSGRSNIPLERLFKLAKDFRLAS